MQIAPSVSSVTSFRPVPDRRKVDAYVLMIARA
jgi:hypothetical protein